jgi:predicted metal-dependent phosphoesterase TrpH
MGLAVKTGLAAIAITDHDTLDGIPQAIKAGSKDNVEVIPGIELTAEWEGSEFHILGYFVNYEEPWFKSILEDVKRDRVERVKEMIRRLKEFGMDISLKEVLRLAPHGSVGRLHLAMVMHRRGHISTVAEAFQRYIGDGGPAYVGRFRFSPTEAIRIITKADGVPVLAHPFIPGKDEIIPQLKEAGLKGIEVLYPEHTSSQRSHYQDLAREYSLLITGGSDFHGQAKPHIILGAIRMPYETVESLKAARPSSA